MDESKTRQKENKKQRKLIRSPEVSVFDIPASVASIAPIVASTVTDVMGGGFTTPHNSLLVGINQGYNHNHHNTHHHHRNHNHNQHLQQQKYQQKQQQRIMCASPELGGFTTNPSSSSSSTTTTTTTTTTSSNIVNSFISHSVTSLVGSVNSERSDNITKEKLSPSPNVMGGELSTTKVSNDTANLSRIQNLLMKTNDTSKSFQMRQQQRSDPTSDISDVRQQQLEQQRKEQGYYNYPITSPNNPFLPEIIAKSYHSDQSASSSIVVDDDGRVSSVQKLSRTPSSPSSSIVEKPANHLTTTSCHDHLLLSGGSHSSKGFRLNSPPTTGDHHHHHHHQLSPPQLTGKHLNPFLRSPVMGSNSSSTSGAQPNDLSAKREEFLKATMKICLVVSPPSSKLQLKSKSLTHLDTLDSLVACHQGSSSISQKPQSEQSDTSPSQHHQHQHQQPQHQQQQQQQQHHQQQLQLQQKQTSIQQHLPPQPHHPSTSSSNTCNKICCLGSTTIHTSGGASGSQSASSSSIQSGIPNNPVTISSQGSVHKKKSSLMNRKKPLLTRSEVSSSEYFSVYFYTEAGGQDEELIPATKGVSLSEALDDALRKRKLNFSQITISDNNFQSFTESGSPPYYTSSLDENTDVESLAGKLLIVTEKDAGKKLGTLQKAASFGSRTRPPRLLSSASTEETTDSEQKAIPGKQLKQRWSGLFGVKNPQQNQLCELLNFYAKNGVPQKSSSLNFDHPNFDLALEYLDKVHKSWRDFVHCDGMSENDVKIQTAIWELVTTEVDYIHALQTVTDLFLACLEAIQDEKLLIDVDQNKLFSNIRDICEANLKFWTLYLFPMVSNSITMHSPLCIDYFQPGFVTFATTFAPYKKYCAEQSTCQFYCKELNRNNALFTAYLAWCESQKMCNRLRLADILVRPMQRLTKYSLLLTAIRKHIVDENDADIMDSMIHSVENFVCSVNTHLTTRQENERLKGIMARIESYDAVDSNNEHLEKLAKQYCAMLDLCSPMKGCATNQGRHLFMEGDLKLKDNIGKVDVHCFLLTDVLLICKTIAKKGQGTLKVIRQPYLTDRIVVKQKDNTLYCVYLNEFQMVVAAFTLQCAEAKSWHDSITKAKHIYSRLKQGSHWDGYNLRYAGSIGTTGVDTLGIKKSPLNSSIGSRVSSLNNSHSGSVELNDSRNISVDFEKTNSLSSDEGSMMSANNAMPQKPKTLGTSPHKVKTSTSNTLVVQPLNSLGQSLPNLNLHPSQASNLYHTYSNNMLLVPGSSHSGNLLSPSHRGISYPPPSPTRATLRRGFAFSLSIKNPPLVKTRNITSQSSINWHHTPATPSTSPQPSPTPPPPPPPLPSSHTTQPNQQQQQQVIGSNAIITTGALHISNESDV